MTESIDGFELRREIGRGGFGIVHLAWQPALHREVALKVLTADATDPAVRARFDRECRAIGSLSSHPNVVAVYGNGITADDRPYLVMEYLSGGTLAERGTLAWRDACEVGVRIAGALATAHRLGIIHRDVKPQNILFTEFETPQLADFGISSIVDGFETRSNSVSASLAYAAPEVLDARPSSAQSDIYGLAATVIGAILGRGPFHRDADSIAGLVARIATAPVPDLRGDGVPDAVCAVLERAMSKRPEDRQPDAATFGRDLAAAAGIEAGLPLTGAVPAVELDADETSADGPDAEVVPLVVPATEASGGRKRLLLVSAAAAAMLLVGGIAAVVAGGGDDKDLNLATVDYESPTSTRAKATTTTTASEVSVLGETTLVDPLATSVPGAIDPTATAAPTPGNTAGTATTGSTGTSGQRTTGTTRTGGSTTGATTGTSGGSTNTASPTAAPATTPVTAAPVTSPPTAAPATTAAPVGNQAPLLPAATFDFRVPIGQNTTIVPAGDKRLAAGWSDPDKTAQWLCLQPLPQTTDWWVDGMNCEGSGLLVAAETPGVRILELRAMECSPGCGAPYSTTRRTVRVDFYVP